MRTLVEGTPVMAQATKHAMLHEKSERKRNADEIRFFQTAFEEARIIHSAFILLLTAFVYTHRPPLVWASQV
jgi:hypothetical protein